LTGYAEAQEISESAFRTQSRTFQALGYARNPSLHDPNAPKFVGDLSKAYEMGGQNIVELTTQKKKGILRRCERRGIARVKLVFSKGSVHTNGHGQHTKSQDGTQVPSPIASNSTPPHNTNTNSSLDSPIKRFYNTTYARGKSSRNTITTSVLSTPSLLATRINDFFPRQMIRVYVHGNTG
jgi:hypothetical protein